MERFADTAQTIASLSGKLDKAAVLAEYFRSLDDPDLLAAARFFAGTPVAGEARKLSVGGRTIVAVAKRLWGFSDAQLGDAYRATGDLGTALGALTRPPVDEGLFPERLTPAALGELFTAMAQLAGKAAGKRREAILERILRACDDPGVATYVIKIVTGDLRAGLRESLVLDAIAQAFEADSSAVRRAAMAAGDAGEVAVAAKHARLDQLRVGYATPIGFMLATPIVYGDAYAELAQHEWLLEDKYDGIRAQAHLTDGGVKLFSRRLNDVTASYPEVIAGLGALSCRAIFDGEIVAMRDGRVLPFRMLQTRLQRKNVDDALVREVPLAYVAFDILALDDEFLIDEPLHERRERLERTIVENSHLRLASAERIEASTDVNVRFDAARARGNEGLMLKRTDSPYAPGRRGKWWLKLKRELSTLDVAVIAVEWGDGKRANVLSDYTFAVLGDDGTLQAIGKAYSGLTDAEIAELTPWFLAHRLPTEAQRPKARAFEIPVEPDVVLEVAFDVIAESDLHESGFALRFPRIVRIRDDKPAADIDTLARVREIYRQMLARERQNG